MKVKELIEKLSKCNPNAEVGFYNTSTGLIVHLYSAKQYTTKKLGKIACAMEEEGDDYLSYDVDGFLTWEEEPYKNMVILNFGD